MKIKKLIQENRYFFPYHYIPFLNGYFSQVRNLYWGYEYLSYLNFVLNKLESLRFNSLLDIGCGEGRLLHEINVRFLNKILLGIDFSPRSISFAKAFNPNLEFICGDIQKIKLPGKYDVITLIEVLEHIPIKEIPNFLQTLYNYLNDAGNLILTVPSNNITLNPKHYQHFNTKTIKNTLSGFFEIKEIFYLNQKGWKTNVISKLLSNRFFILNYRRFIKIIYNFYINRILMANENNAQRICVICEKNKSLL